MKTFILNTDSSNVTAQLATTGAQATATLADAVADCAVADRKAEAAAKAKAQQEAPVTVAHQQGGLFDLSLPDDGNQLREVKIGDTKIVINANANDGTVSVASVRTPQTKRGAGSARAAMQQLIRQADAQGVTLTLDASPLDRKTSLGKLVAFYESLGFEKTGRTANFAGDPKMIRPAQQFDQGGFSLPHCARRTDAGDG